MKNLMGGGGSNETRSEENNSKIDATTEVFTPKALLSKINKPGCILLTGNNRLERELDTDGKERSSLLRLEKDECLLTEGSEVIGRQVIRNEGVYLEGQIEEVKVTFYCRYWGYPYSGVDQGVS